MVQTEQDQLPAHQMSQEAPHGVRDRMLLLGVTASLLLAACSHDGSTSESSQSHKSAGAEETLADFTGDTELDAMVDSFGVARDLMYNRVPDADVEKSLDSIKDPLLNTLVTKSIDINKAKDSNNYAVPSNYDYEESEKMSALVLGSISDPQTKALAQRKLDLSIAADMYTLSYDADTTKLAKRISLVADPAVRAQAQQLFDYAVAKGVRSAPSTDVDNVKASIALIQNPDTKALAQKTFDYGRAKDAMNPYSTPEDAQKALDLIADPDIKARAAAHFRSDTSYQEQSSITTELYALPEPTTEQFDVYNSLLKLKREVDTQLDDLNTQVKSEIEQAIRKSLVDRAQELAVPADYNPEGINNRQLFAPKVRLTEKQKRTVESNKDLPSDTPESEIDRPMFAEITVNEAGEIVVNFPEGTALDEKTKQQINLVLQNTEPFVAAAFKNGNLARIRFLIGDASSFYSQKDREIGIQVSAGAEDKVSMDELSSTLMHETMHALTGGKISGETLSEEQFNRFNKVCMAIADNAEATFTNSVIGMSSNFEAFKKYLPKDQQPVVDVIVNAIEQGTLKDLVLSGDHYSPVLGITSYCNTPNLMDLLEKAASSAGLKFEPSEAALKDDQIAELSGKWYEAVQQLSLYAHINESSYVDTESYANEIMGHSQEDGAELIASFLDDIIYYRSAFAKNVSSMSAEDKATIVELTRVAVDMVAGDNMQLRGLLSDIEADFLQKINS